MNSHRQLSLIDRMIIESDKVLRTLAGGNKAEVQSSPAKTIPESQLNEAERYHAAGLMRINHTGEVCAQALYQGQSLTATLPNVREEMEQAAKEEVDHLNWCGERLQQLDSHVSRFNPVFYGLSFGMGAIAGMIGDRVSLGFVAATEELVCQHLQKHLKKLPDNDAKSRVIVEKMLKDEARHQQAAIEAGGSEFPVPVKLGMTLMSKVMTKTTYYL